MGENKEIKVRLSTVVYLFIILVLVVALGAVYYLGFVKDDNANGELTEKNNIAVNEQVTEKNNISVNEQATETNKLENQTTVEKEDEKVENYDWSVVDTTKIVNKGEGYTYSTTYGTAHTDYRIFNNKRTVATGTGKEFNLSKNIKEFCSYILGQGSLDFYVFLYEDGTVAYADNNGESIKEFNTLKNIIKIMPLDYSRKVEWDDGKMVDLKESTVVAIDNAGNIYDLGLMRNK